MYGMRNEGNGKPYREKIGHHLTLFYGKTFKEGSYWYTHPNENEFFRAVFAKAAGKENADDVDAAGIDNIFFKKENRQMGIDAEALGRYCSERQLKALFAACPASSEEGNVCIEVPAPASASPGAPVKSDKENEEEEEKEEEEEEEAPDSGSPVPAVHGEAGTGEPAAESDDEGTVAHEADVANLDLVLGGAARADHGHNGTTLVALLHHQPSAVGAHVAVDGDREHRTAVGVLGHERGLLDLGRADGERPAGGGAGRDLRPGGHAGADEG